MCGGGTALLWGTSSTAYSRAAHHSLLTVNTPARGNLTAAVAESAGATAGGDCDGGAAGAHGSLLAAVSAQRDRFRAKAQLADEESEKVKRQSNALVMSRAALKVPPERIP